MPADILVDIPTTELGIKCPLYIWRYRRSPLFITILLITMIPNILYTCLFIETVL